MSGSMWIGFQERCWTAARRILVTQDCPYITVARGKSLLETPETERSFVGQDPAPKLSTSANSWAPASFNNVAQVLELVKLLLNASASRAQGKWEGTNSDMRIRQIGWISNGLYSGCKSTWGIVNRICLSRFVTGKGCCSAEVTWNVAVHIFLALHVRIERSPLELTATTVPQRKILQVSKGKLWKISRTRLGVDSAPSLCEDWWFGNGILGSTNKKQWRIFQSYLSTHGKPRLVPSILMIRLDVLRNIPVHCLYDVVTLNNQRQSHSAPFSTGSAVCLMIAKRKVRGGTDAFESWRF